MYTLKTVRLHLNFNIPDNSLTQGPTSKQRAEKKSLFAQVGYDYFAKSHRPHVV